MKLVISFDTNYQLKIKLRDNDFVRRWASLLEEETKRTEILQEDTYSFMLSEFEARNRLINAINEINKFTKRIFISLPNDKDFDDVNFYNTLHEKFEQLAGPDYDQPSKIMIIGPDKIKDAIRQINRYCHRLEKRPYQLESQMRVEFRSPKRKELLSQDFDLFETSDLDRVVLLDYSTLGKSLIECYQDNLNPDYPGMKIQKHYSPNFIIKFKKDESFSKENFINWLKKHGYKDVPASALGAIVLGEYDDVKAEEMIKQTQRITEIYIERGK